METRNLKSLPTRNNKSLPSFTSTTPNFTFTTNFSSSTVTAMSLFSTLQRTALRATPSARLAMPATRALSSTPQMSEYLGNRPDGRKPWERDNNRGEGRDQAPRFRSNDRDGRKPYDRDGRKPYDRDGRKPYDAKPRAPHPDVVCGNHPPPPLRPLLGCFAR